MNRKKPLGPGAKSCDRGSTFAAPRKPIERKSQLERVSSSKSTTGGKGKRSGPISPASKEQREKARAEACVVCRHPSPSDPAHLIDRSLLTVGQDDRRAIVPLCRRCHDAYDHDFDLLPYLEPHRREELAFAVLRFGLMATVRRVTNEREAAA